MILRSLWLRPMRAHPLRTLATVLGVAIGVGSVVSTLLASRAAVASMGADVEVIAGRSRLEVTRPGGARLEDLELLRPVCDEALLLPVVEQTVLAPQLGDLVRLMGIDLLVDGEARQLDLQAPEGGLEEARDTMLLENGAAISRGLADELGLSAGDDLTLLIRSRPSVVRIAALIQPERLASAWSRVVVVDVATAQELYGSFDTVDRFELVPRTEGSVDGLANRVRALLPEGYRVEPAASRRAEGERMVRALDFNLTALAGVSILVGIVLVATTLATSIVQRRPQIALLRSLGAAPRSIAGAVLIEAGAIGLAGGALGVLGGWAGAQAAVASVRETVVTVAEGVIPGQVQFDLTWALVGLALGLGASLVAAVLPLREALSTPPLQGLRAEHAESVARRRWKPRAVALASLIATAILFANLPPLEDRPVWALISALCILSTLLVLSGPLIDLFAAVKPTFLGMRAGVPVRLAQAALEAGRRRAAWAAGAVGVAVGLAVAMTTMVGSFRASVLDWTQQAMRSDLFVRPPATDAGTPAGRIAPGVTDVARELFGTEAVDPFHQSRAYFRGNPVLLGGAAFDVVSREGGVPFLDGRAPEDVFREAHEAGGVVVNEPFARRFSVERGDTIEISTGAAPLRREVMGVYRDYSGHIGRVVLDLPDFLAHYPNEGAHSIAVFLPQGEDVDAARRRLAVALQGEFTVEILNNREVRSEVLEVFDRTFAVTVALQLISSFVAGIAVIAVLTALIHERRRELALVRTLGGSAAQLVALVLGEALLLGLAGAFGGLVVGLVVGWLLVAIVNLQSFGWTLEFITPVSLVWTFLAVIPACLIAGLFPALVSLRTTPRSLLRATV